MAAVTRVWRWLRGHQGVIGFVVFVVGTAAAFRAVDDQRHDQCISGRTDTQAAIVAGMDAAGVDPDTQRIVADAVAEALPVDEC